MSLTCPWCGKTEPNEWLLNNNHWLKLGPLPRWEYDWCRAHDMCIGQSLVLNHLRYDLDNHQNLDRLRHTYEIAEAKWAIRDDKPPILAEARQVIDARERAERPSEHHHVPDSVQDDLFALGGAA